MPHNLTPNELFHYFETPIAKLIGLYFSGEDLGPFHLMVNIASSQSLGTDPSCKDFLNISVSRLFHRGFLIVVPGECCPALTL